MKHIMWTHWTVRTCHPHKPYQEIEFARWFWEKMTALFPDAIAAVQMPNHIHLILPKKSYKASKKLTGLLGAASRRLAQKQLWQPIPKPSLIPDRFHLQRQVRYVALNPCRKGLCKDPLEWHWSTYREVLGAVVQKGEILIRLTSALEDSRPDFKIRFHSYVSGDPSVHVEGTPFPKSTQPKTVPQESIGEILSATAAALRLSPEDVTKNSAFKQLFIHAAYRHGWNHPSLLANICGIKPNSVHWIVNNRTPAGLSCVDLCLGDSRLRRGVSHIFQQSVE